MVSVTGTSNVPATPPSAGLSKSKNCSLTVGFNSVDQSVANPTTLYIAYAKSTAVPATWADLVNPVIDQLAAGDAATFRYRGGGSPLYDGSYTALNARDNAAWTIGDSVYVTLWASATPSSGDVPIAVSSPFLVIA